MVLKDSCINYGVFALDLHLEEEELAEWLTWACSRHWKTTGSLLI